MTPPRTVNPGGTTRISAQKPLPIDDKITMDPAPSLPTAANAAANRAAPPTADKRAALYHLIAFFLEGGIQICVRIHRLAHSRSRCHMATLPARRKWPLRTNTEYPEVVRGESSSRVALVSAS